MKGKEVLGWAFIKQEFMRQPLSKEIGCLTSRIRKATLIPINPVYRLIIYICCISTLYIVMDSINFSYSNNIASTDSRDY